MWQTAFPILLDLVVAWEVLIASVSSAEEIPFELDTYQYFLAILLLAFLEFSVRDCSRLCGISNKSVSIL